MIVLTGFLLMPFHPPRTISSGFTAGIDDPTSLLSSPFSPRMSADPRILCYVGDNSIRLDLSESSIDSIGESFSRVNLSIIQRADSLLRSGLFGEPDSRDATRRAIEYCQLRVWNGMRYLIELSSLEGEVAYGTGEDMVTPFRLKYHNGAVYPLKHLHSVMMGNGGFCASYTIPEKFDEIMRFGGDTKVRIRTVRVGLPDKRGKHLLISREFLSSEHSDVELLFQETIYGLASKTVVVDRGDSLELTIIHDLEGIYVRKAGIHKMGAIIVWKNLVSGDDIPERVRIGGCAYFPELKFALPFFLPDLGLDDLRDFFFPYPVMPIQWFRQPEDIFPSWFEAGPAGTVKPWDSQGPRPDILDIWFPNL